MQHTKNIKVFADTLQKCMTHPTLKKAIDRSVAGQRATREEETVESAQRRFPQRAVVTVSKKRSLAAASAYAGKRVCVLNFASATNPGGGVKRGSSAQEESLCRISTLFPCLDREDMCRDFYRPHREKGDPLHNDDCIYTPEVVVFKSDTAAPHTLPEDMWYPVNVITCAAPNLRPLPENPMNPGEGTQAARLDKGELRRLHEKRLRRILDIAAANGDEVVILGAFGCGAFRNDPFTVAWAMRSVVEEYLPCFAAIEFAVYCRENDDSNYRIFREAMQDLEGEGI